MEVGTVVMIVELDIWDTVSRDLKKGYVGKVIGKCGWSNEWSIVNFGYFGIWHMRNEQLEVI